MLVNAIIEMVAQSLAINRSVDLSRQMADTAYNIRKGDIMKKKLWFTLSAVCFAAFVILIILLKTADAKKSVFIRLTKPFLTRSAES